MRRYRIPSALLSDRLFCIFLDQKLSDLNGEGQTATNSRRSARFRQKQLPPTSN